MVADNNFVNTAVGFKVPQLEEQNLKNFNKFFFSFLMRYTLVLTTRKPEHIHDLDPSTDHDADMTPIQMRMVNKEKVWWRRQNEISSYGSV